VSLSSGGGAGPYTVRLEVFEGPLDLLLHLIRREEMDIYDIAIARITRQYLDYIEGLEELDLDRASEFLLMAATLMDIKSRMLLPRPAAEDYIDEEAQLDPRRELVERLLEYKRYKEAAAAMAERAQAAERAHPRYGGARVPPPSLVERLGAGPAGRDGCGEGPYAVGTAGTETAAAADPGAGLQESSRRDAVGLLGGVTLRDLVWTLQEVLREAAKTPPARIARERVTVAEKLAEIAPLLLEAGERGLDFRDVLRGSRTRLGIIVAFLALLELVRQGRARVAQESPFGPITVWARPGLAHWRWPGRDERRE